MRPPILFFLILLVSICFGGCSSFNSNTIISVPQSMNLYEGQIISIPILFVSEVKGVKIKIRTEIDQFEEDNVKLLWKGNQAPDILEIDKFYNSADLQVKLSSNFTSNPSGKITLYFKILDQDEVITKEVFTVIYLFDNPLETGLVARYRFDGNADDSGIYSTVNGLVGVLDGEVSGATLVADRNGNENSAYFFDGIDDYILVRDNDAIDFGPQNPFTFSLWVKPAIYQIDLTATNNDIISKWNIDAEGYPYAFRVWNQTAIPDLKNRFFCLRYDGSNCNYALQAVDKSPFEEKWYHLLMMRTASGMIKVYKNGEEVHSSPDMAVCLTSNIDNLSIGRRHTGLRYFKGTIDDISIFNRELTESEIDLLSNY